MKNTIIIMFVAGVMSACAITPKDGLGFGRNRVCNAEVGTKVRLDSGKDVYVCKDGFKTIVVPAQ